MIDKNKNLILLMPPKTASNSLKFTLENQGIKFSKPSYEISTPLIHLKLNEIVEIFKIDDLLKYKILQITRNPYSRFVSSYYHLMRITRNTDGVKFSNYDFTKFTQHFYESSKSENFIESFYGNTHFVNHCINNGISWGGSRLFKTQKSWSDLNLNVSYFKLEEISKEISPINDFLSTNISSLSEINKSNLSHQYGSQLTPKIKDIIFEIFEEDFISFRY